MNNMRRKQIQHALTLIEQARDILNECGADERDYFDNMPEGLQNSERGQKAEEDADTLQQAYDDADSLVTLISDLVE